MRTIIRDAAVTTLAVLLLTSAVGAAEGEMANPHSEAGDCGICHVASAGKLRSWFAFASTKREMKMDLNELCRRCHPVEPTHAGGFIGVGKGHATGKKTPINHENLPLANDGTITCAITCHNMHVTAEDRTQQLKHLRLPINKLCLSCHNM